jgi:MoaA/NifB/PqqE/SkfB family radical SAM enzyme
MSHEVFERTPARVYWELTRACDLACRHCRAEAMPERAADELTTEECERVLRELAGAGPPPPHVVFTGGDPLKRPDLVELVRYGVGLGLGVSVAASATPALSRDVVEALKSAGASAMSLSLDGSTPARHDGIRGVLGCFGWTLVAAQRIVNAGIPLQINTLVTAETEPDLEEIAKVVARLGASRWSLFFLVPVGRGRTLRALSARECETTLRWLAARTSAWPFTVTTTEAPHYRRVLIESRHAAGRDNGIARSFGIRDGNGIMFIAANGDVMPSGFLPLVAGNVRGGEVVDIYRHASHFRALRAPETFHGRCGICGFRLVCGGSRARAYAATGDFLAEDPLCAYEPAVAS